MFTSADIQSLLQAKPFVPCRIHMSDGSTVEVRSPELVFPGRRFAVIGILDPAHPEEGFDRYTTVWYMHVTRVKQLRPGGPPTQPPASPSDQPSPTPA